MKKELAIQFKIIQYEDINKQEDELGLTVYSVASPENEDVIRQEELEHCGVKKAIKPRAFKEFITDKIGRKYTYKITAEQLKELFDY